MANYNYRSQFHYSYSAKPVSLYVRVTFASGVASIVSGTGMGIASVAKTATGKYDIVLTRGYGSLIGAQCIFKSAAAPASPIMSIITDGVGAATPKLNVLFEDVTGAAADPADADTALIEVILNDSSLGY